MYMKQRFSASLLFLIASVFSPLATPNASGSVGQGGLFSQQQQSTSQALGTETSQQNYQNGSQQSVRPVDNAGQNLENAPVLTPSQQQNAQDRLLQENEQTTERNERSMNQDRPEPVSLSEFQRLVAASVGRVLPIYGAKLFSNVPTTFAPVSRIPVTPNYVIGPGDELLIRIWGQVVLDGHFTVDRSGAIYIPQVGAIHVSGIPFEEISEFIRSQVGRTFKNFDLNVNMGQLRSIQIFVVGEARRPGSYTVSSLSTLVNALFQAVDQRRLGA